MPTVSELRSALRNAHNAGDRAAAERFAQMIEAQTVSTPPPGARVHEKGMGIATPEQEQAFARNQELAGPGSFLPWTRSPSGEVSFDSDVGILGAAKRAFNLPGEVYRGEFQLNDPQTGMVSEEAIGRGMETAALFNPVNPAVRAGSKLIPGAAQNVRQNKPEVPTGGELLSAGGKAFNEMRDTGAEFASSEVKRMAEFLKGRMNEKGFDDVTAPKTFSTLDKLASPPANSVATIRNLHSARKTLGKVSGDPTDKAAARSAIGKLDEFISGSDNLGIPLAPRSPAQQRAGELLGEANANYAAGKRSDLVQGIERAADLRAAAANSGKNTGNAIRQRVASALLKEKDTAGFNAAEKNLLEGIVQGSKSANRTRDIANRLGGGGGFGSTFAATLGGGAGAGVGSAFGAPVVGGAIGASFPLVAGGMFKGLSNRLTQKALKEADEALRMRSPLFKKRSQNKTFSAKRDKAPEALIRGLLLGTVDPDEIGGLLGAGYEL